MDKERLNDFTKLILKERGRILRKLRNVRDDIERATESRVAEDFEDAQSAVGKEILSDLIQKGTHELEAVNRALERIIEGTYGKCLQCGCDIVLARLEAMPTTAFCVSCQSLKERISSREVVSALRGRKWTVEEKEETQQVELTDQEDE